jgi:hypothetical protein
MAFNKAPNSWLTGYTYTSDQISFSLSGDYTAECQDAMGLIFRVTDEILKKYTAKASADRPVQWESTSVIAQPVQGSPNSLKTITNKFVLDAELFAGLATPSLEVTISTPDMVYTGFAYGAVSHTAPSGSSVTITYSADGGQTFSSTAPTARGSYIARIVATKDGRSGTARSGFSILKSTPTVTAGADITLEYSSGTFETSFFSDADFTSITSSNPAVVSVVSFTSGGDVVLQKNGVGQADIIASTAETSEYYPASGSKAVILTAKEATISAPATLAISVTNGLLQNFDFTTNFTLTPTRYALMEFVSSETGVATIIKGNSYPPQINIVAGGVFVLTATFPGDSEYGEVASTTSVTIAGATPEQTVTVSKGPSQASFSGDDGIVVTEPSGPWVTGKLWTVRIGLDSDNNGELDGQIPTLPYVFTITIANTQGQQGTTGALSTSFTNFVSNNWISFSVSGNVITATISSSPTTTNNGEVSGCSLFASRAAADGVLAWQGQFDINVYKAGSRLRFLASGLSGTANSVFTEITQSSLTLNSNGEYSEWLTSEECCPHVIRMKVLKADMGGSGSISVEARSSGGWAFSDNTGFAFNATSIVVSEGEEFDFNVYHGGASILRAYLTGANPNYQKDVAITASRFTPSLSLDGGDRSTCADSIVDLDGVHQCTVSTATFSASPEGIAWDGLTTSRLNISFSRGSASVAQKIQQNGGKTRVSINNNYTGDSVMTTTLAQTDKYNSISITKNYRVVKPYLFTEKSVSTNTIRVMDEGSNVFGDATGTYKVKQQSNTLKVSACQSPPFFSTQISGDVPIIYTHTYAAGLFDSDPPQECMGTSQGNICYNPKLASLYGRGGSYGQIVPARRRNPSINTFDWIRDNYYKEYTAHNSEGVYGLADDSGFSAQGDFKGSIAYFTDQVITNGTMRYEIIFRQHGMPFRLRLDMLGSHIIGAPRLDYTIGDVKLYLCPTLPYKDGSIGDYYQMPPVSPTTLTAGVDFNIAPWVSGVSSGLISASYFGTDLTLTGYEIPIVT